jgi:hypothetical protein
MLPVPPLDCERQYSVTDYDDNEYSNLGYSTLGQLQHVAVCTFIMFVSPKTDATSNIDKTTATHTEDIAELKKLLPLKDIVLVISEECDDKATDDSGQVQEWFFGADSQEEFTQKTSTLVIKLVSRLMSNMMSYGASRDLLEVSFDDVEGFVFEPTQKAKDLFNALKDREEKENPHDDEENTASS